jgi:hypothetical protein
VNDAERAGIGIVNADLIIGELMLDQIIFHALVAERPRRIEAQLRRRSPWLANTQRTGGCDRAAHRKTNGKLMFTQQMFSQLSAHASPCCCAVDFPK